MQLTHIERAAVAYDTDAEVLLFFCCHSVLLCYLLKVFKTANLQNAAVRVNAVGLSVPQSFTMLNANKIVPSTIKIPIRQMETKLTRKDLAFIGGCVLLGRR